MKMVKISMLMMLVSLVFVQCKSRKGDKSTKAADGKMIPSIIVNTEFVAPEKNHPFTVKSTSIDGHILNVEVEYSGGCEKHNFTLHTNKMYMKSMPPKLGIFLKHDNGGDNCREMKTEQLQFDLQACQYPTDREEYSVMLMMNNWKGQLEYKY